MTRVGTIAWLTFREARRRRTALAALVLGLLFLALFITVFSFVTREIATEMREDGARQAPVEFAYTILLLAGFYVVHVLAVMLTIFSTAGALSGEISTHVIQTIATKPLRRGEILLGKWLGHGAMLALYIVFLGGGLWLGVRIVSGFAAPGVGSALLLVVLEALVLLTVSLALGTRLSSVATGVLLTLLYGLTFAGGWIGQIGNLIQSPSAMRIGEVAAHVLPVEALWRRAAFLMQPPFLAQLPVSPFTGGAPPSEDIVGYASAYVVAVLGVAMWAFERRDL
jgi:ABC-type transport system involved in multi-copper enzyme maturation permease subunit